MAVDKPKRRGTMEIYDGFKWPESVPVVEWKDLTEEQKRLVLDAYRFSGYVPGTYQGVTFAGKNADF
jgi:hypothetical protein